MAEIPAVHKNKFEWIMAVCYEIWRNKSPNFLSE